MTVSEAPDGAAERVLVLGERVVRRLGVGIALARARRRHMDGRTPPSARRPSNVFFFTPLVFRRVPDGEGVKKGIKKGGERAPPACSRRGRGRCPGGLCTDAP